MKFDLIVEGPPGGPKGDFSETSPNALELTNLEWDGEPPDIIRLERGSLLMKVGRYASPGNRYRYRVPSEARLHNGRLMA